jgi:hypothetical protein
MHPPLTPGEEPSRCIARLSIKGIAVVNAQALLYAEALLYAQALLYAWVQYPPFVISLVRLDSFASSSARSTDTPYPVLGPLLGPCWVPVHGNLQGISHSYLVGTEYLQLFGDGPKCHVRSRAPTGSNTYLVKADAGLTSPPYCKEQQLREITSRVPREGAWFGLTAFRLRAQ